MVDAVGGQQPPAPLGEQAGLVRVGHLERVDLVRARPRSGRRAPARPPARPARRSRPPRSPWPTASPSRRPARRPAPRRPCVRSTPAANPQAPPCTTRTAKPTSVASDGAGGPAVAQRQDGAAHPLEAGSRRARRPARGRGPAPRRRAPAAAARGMTDRPRGARRPPLLCNRSVSEVNHAAPTNPPAWRFSVGTRQRLAASPCRGPILRTAR